MKKNLKFYTVNELAEVLRVHPTTIYQSIRCGRINAFRVGPGKKAPLRIYHHEVERMIEFDAKKMIDKIVEDRVKKETKDK